MAELALKLAREQQDTPGVVGLSLDYRLRWLDFDRYGNLKPSAVMDIFQDVALVQSEEMGIGYEEMLAHRVFWAVIRQKFEIVRQTEVYQVARARTWPHSLSRFSFSRDNSLRDEEGNLLSKASAEYVLMDIDTRKFVKATDIVRGDFVFDDTRAFSEKLRKLPDFEADPGCVSDHVASYSDIDQNGHVNNALYARYAMDAVVPKEGEVLKTVQIDYRHELVPDVPFQMHVRREGPIARAKGVLPDGEIAFSSLLEFTCD